MNYYDDANRLETTVYYGSRDHNDGDVTLQASPLPTYDTGTHTAFESSADRLVTQQTYNTDTGRPELSKGTAHTSSVPSQTKTFYDDLGRTVAVAENWVNYAYPSTEVGGGTDNEEDRVTRFEYNGLGGKTKLIAVNATSSGTIEQETLYLFEDDYNASLVTNTIYPDSSDTDSSGTDQVKMTYHLDGSIITQTDQRGVVHTYQYDNQRRVELDRVTSFGTSGIVDDTVKSIGRSYDTLGRTTAVTSYGTNDGSGTPVNQLAYTYDGSYGTLTETEQEHDGAVDGSTLSVQYLNDTTASSNVLTNGLRLKSIYYPWHQANSKYLRLYHGASGSATFDRFDRLHQVSGQFQQGGSYPIADDYRYAGVNRLMTARTRWNNGGANQLYLHYDGAALGTGYKGYDRFGRVRGHSTSGGSAQSGFHYEYDYAGNREHRDTIGSDSHDQVYQYDDLNRLIDSQQGQLTGSTFSSKTAQETFTLDQFGNWATYKRDYNGDATWDINQEREHNEANELESITSNVGLPWATPQHDAAGNMKTLAAPIDPELQTTAKYDAWNRLTYFQGYGTYQYDGLHRRIVRADSFGGSARHFYYNENWQCVEERDASYTFVKRHHWHAYYIDA